MIILHSMQDTNTVVIFVIRFCLITTKTHKESDFLSVKKISLSRKFELEHCSYWGQVHVVYYLPVRTGTPCWEGTFLGSLGSWMCRHLCFVPSFHSNENAAAAEKVLPLLILHLHLYVMWSPSETSQPGMICSKYELILGLIAVCVLI